MKTWIIEAIVLGERVTLVHRPATQRYINEWYEKNEKRLTEKGFEILEAYSYYEEE